VDPCRGFGRDPFVYKVNPHSGELSVKAQRLTASGASAKSRGRPLPGKVEAKSESLTPTLLETESVADSPPEESLRPISDRLANFSVQRGPLGRKYNIPSLYRTPLAEHTVEAHLSRVLRAIPSPELSALETRARETVEHWRLSALKEENTQAVLRTCQGYLDILRARENMPQKSSVAFGSEAGVALVGCPAGGGGVASAGGGGAAFASGGSSANRPPAGSPGKRTAADAGLPAVPCDALAINAPTVTSLDELRKHLDAKTNEQFALMQQFMSRVEASGHARDEKLEAVAGSLERVVSRLDAMEAREATAAAASEAAVNECVAGLVKKVEDLSARLDAVSMPPPNATPRSLVGSSRRSSTAGSGATSSVVQQRRSAHDASEPFVPTRCYIRGWSDFGDREKGINGITESDARKVAESLLNGLPAPHCDRVTAGRFYHRNWQIALVWRRGLGSDECWDTLKLLRSLIEKRAIKINGRVPYISMQNSPERTESNRCLRIAEHVVGELGKDIELKTDWPAGELWTVKFGVAPLDIRLGFFHHKKEVWVWQPENLQTVNLTLEEVEARCQSI
jgi:hypothetical protein